MNLMPLYEKIVILTENKQEVTSSTGLSYVKNMSMSSHTTMKGKVVAVGDGRLLSDGAIVPLKVKVGDTVLYSKMSGESYDDGTNQYTILSESNVLAIEKEDNNGDN